VCLQSGCRHGDRGALALGQRDGYLGNSYAHAASDDGRGILAGFAQHQVRQPIDTCPLHLRQHGGSRQAAEELPVAENGGLLRGDQGQVLPDRRHLLLGGLPTGPERIARCADHLGQGGRTDHERLVSSSIGGRQEGQQRTQMAGTAKVTEAAIKAGVSFSIAAKLYNYNGLHKVIGAIPEEDWRSIPYWIGDGAQVAETTYRPFSKDHPQVRLIDTAQPGITPASVSVNIKLPYKGRNFVTIPFG
jgi:hypothetical protein